jgi:predicted RNA-binding Zn-ribbon protein involved in translation (DUF1610 family)
MIVIDTGEVCPHCGKDLIITYKHTHGSEWEVCTHCDTPIAMY